jgi:hypothetical protein
VNRTTVEMTGYGRHGKPKSRFPTAPTALGNRQGDSHIPTAEMKRGKVENETARFPLSRYGDMRFLEQQKGGLAADRCAPAFRLIVRLENALSPPALENTI